MKSSLETSILTLAFAGALVLPAILPGAAAAADDSYTGRAVDGAKSAGEAVKNGAESAGSAVTSGAKSAAGYTADTAKNATARLHGKDALFVRKATIGNLAEIKSAELAKEKASSAEVKSFAEQMVTDHTKANQDLAQIAKNKDITLPTDVDNEHQAKLDKLSKLSGAAFDKAYLKQQRMGHETMAKLLADEIQNGKDPDLKAFAKKTKTVVSEHRSQVEKIAGNAGTHQAVSSGR